MDTHNDLDENQPQAVSFYRTEELAIDPFSMELGSASSKPVREITETSNRFNGAKVGNWRVNGEVTAIHHGTYRERAAVFLAFRFRHTWDIGASDRIVRADIEVCFLPENKSSDRRTRVVVCAPRKLTTNLTPANIVDSVARDHGFSINPGQQLPFQFDTGTKTERTMQRTFDKTFAVSIEGIAKQSQGSRRERGPDDVVVWRIRENGALEEGIPHEVTVAVVVETEEDSLVAMVKTTAQTNSGIGRFGVLWPKEEPLRVVRSGGVTFGPAPRTARFEELGEDDWSSWIDVI